MPKREALTIEFKLQLIKAVDEDKVLKKDIRKDHEIPFSTLSTILAKRSKAEQASQDLFYKKTMKKIKACENPEVEKGLVIWCQHSYFAYNKIWIKRSKTAGPVDFVLTAVYCIT